MGTWIIAAVVFALIASNVPRDAAIGLGLLIVLGALVINQKKGGNIIGDLSTDFSNTKP